MRRRQGGPRCEMSQTLGRRTTAAAGGTVAAGRALCDRSMGSATKLERARADAAHPCVHTTIAPAPAPAPATAQQHRWNEYSMPGWTGDHGVHLSASASVSPLPSASACCLPSAVCLRHLPLPPASCLLPLPSASASASPLCTCLCLLPLPLMGTEGARGCRSAGTGRRCSDGSGYVSIFRWSTEQPRAPERSAAINPNSSQFVPIRPNLSQLIPREECRWQGGVSPAVGRRRRARRCSPWPPCRRPTGRQRFLD
eukprot:SAG31_NODE_1363_length_8627_cov_5.967402_12_plen_255_part_00